MAFSLPEVKGNPRQNNHSGQGPWGPAFLIVTARGNTMKGTKQCLPFLVSLLMAGCAGMGRTGAFARIHRCDGSLRPCRQQVEQGREQLSNKVAVESFLRNFASSPSIGRRAAGSMFAPTARSMHLIQAKLCNGLLAARSQPGNPRQKLTISGRLYRLPAQHPVAGRAIQRRSNHSRFHIQL